MMKIFLALLCFLAAVSVNAQFKTIAAGPVFEEPETGFTKLLLLKNGGTIFFHITQKDGINVKIYDEAHQQKVDKNIKPAYGTLKDGDVSHIFEIKGSVILLIREVDGKTPILYRLIVDANTGELKEEKRIAELNKMSLREADAVAGGDVSTPDFFVRKDPYSDNYAVASFSSFASDPGKRIEVILYGEDHNEIARANYASSDDQYKYLKYIDMTVIGTKVNIIVFAHNKGKNKDSELLLANLNAGQTTISAQPFKFTQDRTVKWGITRYNPVTKKVMMIIAATTDESSVYETFLCRIDPFTQKLEKVTSAAPGGLEEDYTGLPQNLFINKDGSFTIVYEKMSLVSGNFGSRGQFYASDTYLDYIAISLYDKEEKHIKSYLIKKKQYIGGISLHPFYLSEREGSAQVMYRGNQYKSFAYLNGGSQNFVLINDVERNRESTRGDKITPISGLAECDDYYFNISGNNGAPERNYLFGKPADKKTHNLALFAISDYNSDSNIYTTLKLEKEGKEKGVKVIWLQP